MYKPSISPFVVRVSHVKLVVKGRCRLRDAPRAGAARGASHGFMNHGFIVVKRTQSWLMVVNSGNTGLTMVNHD